NLYYSPYPSLLDYNVKFWYDFLILLAFLIYTWTKQPCCSAKEPLATYSICLLCCPHCVCCFPTSSSMLNATAAAAATANPSPDLVVNPQNPKSNPNPNPNEPNPTVQIASLQPPINQADNKQQGFYHEHEETQCYDKVICIFLLSTFFYFSFLSPLFPLPSSLFPTLIKKKKKFPRMKSAEIGVEETKYVDIFNAYRNRNGSITMTPVNLQKVNLQVNEMISSLKSFFESLTNSEVLIFLLTNMKTNELNGLLATFNYDHHVNYDCTSIIASRSKEYLDDHADAPNQDMDENEIDIYLRIVGVDSKIRQKDGMTLPTILLKIMQVTKCPHDRFLYVDCHKAILSHLTQIQLCKTLQIEKKGLVTQNELDAISAMT
ncbi:sensor histidine kinase, partial [Reticulomyxa filosa]